MISPIGVSNSSQSRIDYSCQASPVNSSCNSKGNIRPPPVIIRTNLRVDLKTAYQCVEISRASAYDLFVLNRALDAEIVGLDLVVGLELFGL